MQLLNRIPALFRHKYFIALAVFCAVMLFFDKNDVFTQMERRKELAKAQQSKAYFTKAIAAERKVLEAFETSLATPEKIAREKYLMKKDNEELFLVPENYDTEGNTGKN